MGSSVKLLLTFISYVILAFPRFVALVFIGCNRCFLVLLWMLWQLVLYSGSRNLFGTSYGDFAVVLLGDLLFRWKAEVLLQLLFLTGDFPNSAIFVPACLHLAYVVLATFTSALYMKSRYGWLSKHCRSFIFRAISLFLKNSFLLFDDLRILLLGVTGYFSCNSDNRHSIFLLNRISYL